MAVSEAPIINLRPAVPNVVYTGSQHLFVQRLGVDLSDTKGPVTMKSILAEVALATGYSIDELKGPRRYKSLAHARQEAMWRMVKTGKYSLPQIGLFMGQRDHSTVWFAYHSHEARKGGAMHPAFARKQRRSRVTPDAVMAAE